MKQRLLSAFLLLTYTVILIKVLVFKDLPAIRMGFVTLNFGGEHEGPANLIPFKTILPYLLGEQGFLIACINLLGNIVLLVPIGFLAPLVYRNMTWKKSLALGIAAGFAIEGTQLFLRVGIFDIDDVILNALGVILGYRAFILATKWISTGKFKYIVITTVIIMAASGTLLYAFYPKAQRRMNSGTETNGVYPRPDIGVDTVIGQVENTDNGQAANSESGDLCNGTGGTGQIVGLAKNKITIKRGDGVLKNIILTDRTRIRNSAGALKESDLKTGDRVTVVIDGSETASVVLVCKTK